MWFSLTNFDPNPNLSHAKDQMNPAQVLKLSEGMEKQSSRTVRHERSHNVMSGGPESYKAARIAIHSI